MINDCFIALGESQYFTTLDGYSGYCHMSIKKHGRRKTAFVCGGEMFQCRRRQFRLTNAPACFQWEDHLFLTRFTWKKVSRRSWWRDHLFWQYVRPHLSYLRNLHNLNERRQYFEDQEIAFLMSSWKRLSHGQVYVVGNWQYQLGSTTRRPILDEKSKIRMFLWFFNNMSSIHSILNGASASVKKSLHSYTFDDEQRN